MRHVVAIAVAIALLGQAVVSWAASDRSESTVEQIGYGTGSVVGSAVYFPFKAVFCILGGIGSGVTWAVAGRDKAEEVASVSCRGTWVITPEVVKGKEPVKFIGDTPAREQARAAR